MVDRLEKAGYMRRERDHERPPQGLHLGRPEKTAAEIGKFYVPMQRGDGSSCGAATRTMSCGCCWRFANKGYKSILEATEAA